MSGPTPPPGTPLTDAVRAVLDQAATATAGGPEADAVAALAERLASETGLRVHPAKMSVELHPPIDEDKGTVLSRLAADHAGPVLFAGDDVGDLPAFAALDSMRAAGTPVVKVVVRSAELAPELATAADLTVDGPAEALALLRSLAAALAH